MNPYANNYSPNLRHNQTAAVTPGRAQQTNSTTHAVTPAALITIAPQLQPYFLFLGAIVAWKVLK